MNLLSANKIYCLGIGGIGVSALARFLTAAGKAVTGSDLKSSSITQGLEELGIKVKIGSNKVEGNPDLIIYTPAMPEQELARIAVPRISQGQAIGELMQGKYGIGITGTNGKSTTAAMLGLILDAAELDPSVLLGTMLLPANENEKFKANARFGAGRCFVAESDEYRRKMLANQPRMIVITNIAEDHLDYYKDLAEIKAAFGEYIKSLPPDGILIYNADDHNTVEVCREAKCHKFTFGIKHYADLQALNLRTQNGKQEFDLHLNDEKIGSFELSVPGEFNVANALAANLAAIKLGVQFEVIKKTLAEFAGTWRRFEIVGQLNGKPVISDYAHHPAAVVATIKAATEFYTDKKILVVFQPHQRNRTKMLFGEFVEALMGTQELILPEIFDVAGREQGEIISSFQLADELRKQGVNASFAETLDQAGSMIKQKASQFDVILIMGAGDIDSLARSLVKLT